MSIREGRIIYLHRALPDPQGTNGDYNRPWIIINTKKELERGDDLTIVASTTSFDKPITNPSLFVPLRYGSFSTSKLRIGTGITSRNIEE